MPPKNSSLRIRVIRVCIYAFIPLILVVAFYVELNPSGLRHSEYRVGTPSPLVSQFFPAQRLTKPERGFQVMKEEPVYVTVRYPHRYDTARVRVLVDNPNKLAWQLGIATGKNSSWSYALQQPDGKGEVTFTLAEAQVLDGRLRFIIAVPQLTEEKRFMLEGFMIDFKRESLLKTLQRKWSSK
jgi:hypothetical protein